MLVPIVHEYMLKSAYTLLNLDIKLNPKATKPWAMSPDDRIYVNIVKYAFSTSKYCLFYKFMYFPVYTLLTLAYL